MKDGDILIVEFENRKDLGDFLHSAFMNYLIKSFTCVKKENNENSGFLTITACGIDRIKNSVESFNGKCFSI